MPRITKRQKDHGKEVKPKSKPRSASGIPGKNRSSNHSVNSKGAGAGGAGAKGGFKVGPSHAPRNAYLGKAKKIKADLIDRARLKKSYAKVLKAEGMESGRMRPREKNQESGDSVGASRSGNEGGARGSDNGFGGDADVEEKRGESSRPRKPLDMSRPTNGEESTTATRKASSSSFSSAFSRKGKGKDREPRPRSRSSLPSSSLPSSSQDQSRGPPPHQPPTRVRALSPLPPTISHPMPITELRQLKKEAFAKYHPPRAGPVGSGAGGGGGGGRAVSASSMGSARSGFSFGRAGAGGGGKMRGQPNMGARMGVLLEKIKRDKVV